MESSRRGRDRPGRHLAGCNALALCLPLLSCARMEPPPGGPPDAEPPRLLATVPESIGPYDDYDGPIQFIFDEVIAEAGGPAARGSRSGLARLVILSPTREEPKVRWRRSRITVEPEEGWQAGRVYRAELLPGVTDLRNNRSDERTVVTFSTGAPLPTTTLAGRVVDWSSSRPAANALVEALLLPDSLRYRALADSSGRFSVGPLPAGEYLVSGVLDQNSNLRADAREAFDTARVARGRTEVGELWAFVHDTAPPRASRVAVGDSVSAVVELSQSLDPRARFEPRNATVSMLPDSTPVRVASVLPKPLDDSLHARAPMPADTAAPDTTGAPPPGPPGARRPLRPEPSGRLTTRPPLSNQLVVRVAAPWKPGGRYGVEIRGVRNVSGATGDVRGTLVVPERAAATDSLQPPAPADSVPDEEE